MSKTKRQRSRTSISAAGSISPQRRPPAQPDLIRLAIDALIALVGLGIIVVRGLLGHGGPVYVASGAVFLAFGLWRLKQYVDSRQ